MSAHNVSYMQVFSCVVGVFVFSWFSLCQTRPCVAWGWGAGGCCLSLMWVMMWILEKGNYLRLPSSFSSSHFVQVGQRNTVTSCLKVLTRHVFTQRGSTKQAGRSIVGTVTFVAPQSCRRTKLSSTRQQWEIPRESVRWWSARWTKCPCGSYYSFMLR